MVSTPGPLLRPLARPNAQTPPVAGFGVLRIGLKRCRVAPLPTLRKVYNSREEIILFIIILKILSTTYFLHAWIVLTQRWQRGNVGNTIPTFTAILRKFTACPARKNSLPREQLLPLMLAIPTINTRKNVASSSTNVA